MPEKRSENKLTAALVRSGLMRSKNKSNDGASDSDPNMSERFESDIKPLFDPPADVMRVTPAARQPIPGMPNPVFPTEKTDHLAQDGSQEEPSYPVTEMSDDLTVPESDSFEEMPELPIQAAPPPPPVVPPPPPPPVAPPPPPPPEPAAPPRSAPSFGRLNIFKNGNGSHAGQPLAAPVAPVVAESVPQPENYTDRFLNTEELYEALALRSKKTDTIYLIEEYLQTLPDSLPDAQRRSIVSKLLAASGFDYDLLMGDGVLRVKMLKEYAERFARYTDDYIAARHAELDELEQQTLRTRKLIENRRELHKKQFFSIEAEAQRLKEILTFISG